MENFRINWETEEAFIFNKEENCYYFFANFCADNFKTKAELLNWLNAAYECLKKAKDLLEELGHSIEDPKQVFNIQGLKLGICMIPSRYRQT